MSAEQDHPEIEGVAVVGMACRFPGARNVERLRRNLEGGVESIRRYDAEELRAAGIPEAVFSQPGYVPAGGPLEGVDLFDAPFFDYTAGEAALLAPEHRLFLECCWQALESAGHGDVGTREGALRVGVFGGAGYNTYLRRVLEDPERRTGFSHYQSVLSNDKDFLATRVAYKLNLKGPALTLQTACSTSLVAVHVACQALENGECDLALAGGASVHLPQTAGYTYQEGGIASPDGRCRPFDARAQGTVGSSGAGVVALKRLADALADGDVVDAVIRGSAIGNDGSQKVAFTAPGIDGQVAVLTEAMEIAGFEPESIGYVETHGTATPLGDPIEIAALTRAFRSAAQRPRSCALGAIKSNLGHTDTAAGVAGLIKAVLSLRHRRLYPTLHFTEPNPEIDFASGPFYVNAELAEWKSPEGTPRRAGVSSFGIGGTNAHVVLEEAPARGSEPPGRPWQLLVLSAKTETALEATTERLAEALGRDPGENGTDAGPDAGRTYLADVSFTLQRGRRAFPWRRAVVCDTPGGAAEALAGRDPLWLASGRAEGVEPAVVFLFPGQGAQHAGMGGELYRTEPAFRETVDRCAEILLPHLELDLRSLLYPEPAGAEAAGERLRQTVFAQSSLFVVEYALAQLWAEWGVKPRKMIGHSIGEYVAACLAGVFSLEDALLLVARRGRLMQSLPPGAMLSVTSTPETLAGYLGEDVSLAAVNAPSRCVASGDESAVAALEKRLAGAGVESRRLHTSHAFHSSKMEPVREAFAAEVAAVERRPPSLPFLSNLTGDWIGPDEATDPRYWARHLCETVRFSEGMSRLLESEEAPLLLEVGPGQTLCALAAEHDVGAGAVASMRPPREAASDAATLLRALGRVWLAGAEIDWEGFWKHENRRRVRLPTYPFERQRHWVEAPSPPAPAVFPDNAAAMPDDTTVVELIERQLRILSAQLEILRQDGTLS